MEKLLIQQKNVLKTGWIYTTPEIIKDTDFTWANWAIYTGFSYRGGSIYLFEELHGFVNPIRRKITTSPSPISAIYEDSYMPKDWNFIPKYAERFVLKCYGGDLANNPDNCLVITGYQEFTFVFYLPMRSMITLNELKVLLETTDEFMNDYLQNSSVQKRLEIFTDLSPGR